jgi:F-type H+-transporting ATPase subunit epsilon
VKLEIITPDANIFSGRVKSVNVPGKKGPFQVLRDHAPIISTLDSGEVTVVDSDGKRLVFKIGGGVIEVKMNSIVILAES